MTTHLPIKTSLLLAASFFCLLFPPSAYAAKFSVELSNTSVAPGSEVTASVYLDTEGESINAVGGTLSVPEFFEVVSVRDGSSVVPVWVEAPKALGVPAIVFAGITPGGYRGERGFLFSVVFQAGEKELFGTLALRDLQAFKNDGQGTAAKAVSVSAKLTVSDTATSATSTEKTDTTQPEPFTIQITQTPDAFDAQKVLVFATQDKDSGIDRYEVCEGFFAKCTKGESAYILKRQRADGRITVVAYDVAGNTRVAHLYTPAAVICYALYLLLAILIGVGVRFFFRRKK